MGKFQRSINSHIFWGISGALTTVLLFHLYAWMFTLGSTALQLFEGWLILLPVALTIGAVAGVLSWALTPQFSSFASGLAIAATIIGIFYTVPQTVDHLAVWRAVNRELWLARVILKIGFYPVALLIGSIMVELVIACLIFLCLRLSEFLRLRLKF
ncbi:hypothetical protein [Caldilinea sp.]|jgi:hypothetical protein|uniref:hypothetical protein n=1 Tax=Caldilinea sp. TaxID=2293560 RepID=UPI00260C6C5A|nr:hypothetical protein [Caldilinea sp.]